jgi:hypothetical protein
MAATVLIREKNTVSETATDKTSGTVRFKVADDSNVDNNNPMVKPGAGTNFSFRKYLRGDITVSPAGSITNWKFYTDGAQSNTGVVQYAKTTNPGTYSTPVVETAITGYTDAFTYNSGAPKQLDAVNTGPYTATGDFGDYLLMCMTVGTTVTAPGTLTAEVMTFSWDET